MGVRRMRLQYQHDSRDSRRRKRGLTLRGSDDDGSALGDVWDSSPRQEEGTVLQSQQTILADHALDVIEVTHDVGLHGPVELLGGDISDTSLVVLQSMSTRSKNYTRCGG